MVTRISIGKLFRAIQFADVQAMLRDTKKRTSKDYGHDICRKI